MGKTRKCRLNENEVAVHEMAVKLRKKTDEQLVDAFQEIYDQGYQNGIKQNKISECKIFVSEEAKGVFLAKLQNTSGIGKAIYEKVEKMVIQEN
jgi:hypothetical protein